MNFIVLASGRGSRLKKETINKPKCLIKIYNNQTLIDFISKNFLNHYNNLVLTGYKSNLIEKHLKHKNVKFINNKNYLKTNMVESLMLSKKVLIKKDILIVYGDIFFDKNILKKLVKIKGNIIPINANWLKSWKKRYKTIEKIKSDAEDLIISRKNIISIGNKITKKIPKYQYMGILKISFKSFLKLHKFYQKLKNKKIGLTQFIDRAIKAKITKFKFMPTAKYWFEVDNIEDLSFLKREIKKLF